MALFALGSGNTHKGFLSYAPKHLTALWADGKHRLHEKTTPSFIADLSDSADFVTMRHINVGGILHQQRGFRSVGLLSCLLQVRLNQCCKRHLWLVTQTIQGFGLFPGVHVSWQRTQRVLRQVAGRFDRPSRSTQIVQLDVPKGPLGPAFGVQQVLRIHL